MKLELQFVTPLWFATTRMLLGALCLLAFLALRRYLAIPRREDMTILIIVSGLILISAGVLAIPVGDFKQLKSP